MLRPLTCLALALAPALAGCASPPQRTHDRTDRVYATLDTSLGGIVLELDPVHAPVSVANFLSYADQGFYDDTIFHRVVPGFVIQGGGHLPDLTELKEGSPIINEWRNGLKNSRGTIGMAREAEPDSATRQWYINLADNLKLDTAREQTGNAGYAVFGRVVRGMEVVDAIAAVETYDQEGEGDDVLHDIPVETVLLRRVRVRIDADD